MKKLFFLSILVMMLPLRFAFSKANDNCERPGGDAKSIAKYDCAPNALASSYADSYSRFHYKGIVFRNLPESSVLARAVIENRLNNAANALHQGQNPNAQIWLPVSWCGDDERVMGPCFQEPMRLLDFAAMVGNVEAIKLLLSSPSIRVNDSPDFSSAITQATQRAHPAALKAILQDPRLRIGAKTPIVFQLAYEALFYDRARSTDVKEVVRLLLADGRLDPNQREKQAHIYAAEATNIASRHREGETTPLMDAAVQAQPEIIEVLLQDSRVRSGINLKSDSGKTALSIAAMGASLVKAKNFSTQSEADATKRNYDKCVELLVSKNGKKSSIFDRIFGN